MVEKFLWFDIMVTFYNHVFTSIISWTNYHILQRIHMYGIKYERYVFVQKLKTGTVKICVQQLATLVGTSVNCYKI